MTNALFPYRLFSSKLPIPRLLSRPYSGRTRREFLPGRSSIVDGRAATANRRHLHVVCIGCALVYESRWLWVLYCKGKNRMHTSETSWDDLSSDERSLQLHSGAARVNWGAAASQGNGYGGAAVMRRQPLFPGELAELLDLSGRIGRDPLLVQGSTGNTSVKIDGTLWVKASGKWLANAGRETILAPVRIEDCRERFARGEYFPSPRENSCSSRAQPSVETFLHAVLPHRVVVHVHSVNTVAWAVSDGAGAQLEQRLYGLRWRWIRYAESGAPLARRIRSACRQRPDPNVFLLANHGLVVCGDDCKQVEALLEEVERRLAVPARIVPQPNYTALERVRDVSGWQLPQHPTVHMLGTDRHARRMSQGGVLYPCQATFLGTRVYTLSPHEPPSVLKRRMARVRQSSPFVVVERSGVLVSEDISAAEDAALRGYAEVLRRVETSATIRYLSKKEVRTVLQHASS